MVRTVGIIGSGIMGSGIAQVMAVGGFDVSLHDISPVALTAGMERIKADLRLSTGKGRISAADAGEALARIRPRKAMGDLGTAHLIIEAAAEDLEIKKEILRKLDRIASHDTIFATNTSSFSITSLASVTGRPHSVIGMHFFNPPMIMKLVEIVRGTLTADATVEAIRTLVLRLGKTPVVCKDTPGFIVNRCARPFYGEALRLLGEGLATVEQIDLIVRTAGGFKMGPFELMDLIGIDVNYAVTRSIYEQFFHEPRFRPHPIQRQMVEAGRLGRKTKRGFYTYE